MFYTVLNSCTNRHLPAADCASRSQGLQRWVFTLAGRLCMPVAVSQDAAASPSSPSAAAAIGAPAGPVARAYPLPALQPKHRGQPTQSQASRSSVPSSARCRLRASPSRQRLTRFVTASRRICSRAAVTFAPPGTAGGMPTGDHHGLHPHPAPGEAVQCKVHLMHCRRTERPEADRQERRLQAASRQRRSVALKGPPRVRIGSRTASQRSATPSATHPARWHR